MDLRNELFQDGLDAECHEKGASHRQIHMVLLPSPPCSFLWHGRQTGRSLVRVQCTMVSAKKFQQTSLYFAIALLCLSLAPNSLALAGFGGVRRLDDTLSLSLSLLSLEVLGSRERVRVLRRESTMVLSLLFYMTCTSTRSSRPYLLASRYYVGLLY